MIPHLLLFFLCTGLFSIRGNDRCQDWLWLRDWSRLLDLLRLDCNLFVWEGRYKDLDDAGDLGSKPHVQMVPINKLVAEVMKSFLIRSIDWDIDMYYFSRSNFFVNYKLLLCCQARLALACHTESQVFGMRPGNVSCVLEVPLLRYCLTRQCLYYVGWRVLTNDFCLVLNKGTTVSHYNFVESSPMLGLNLEISCLSLFVVHVLIID